MKRFHLSSHFLPLLLALGVLLAGCGGESEQQNTAGATSSGNDGQGRTVEAGAGTAAGKAAGKVGAEPGNVAPDFQLKNLAGETVSLSDHAGELVFIDFWATWCAPCKIVMPHLQEIHEKYGEKGVTILAISVDRNARKVVPPFIEKNGYTFPVLVGDQQVGRKFGGIRAIPTTVVVKPDGTIFTTFSGARPKSVYLDIIKKVRPELLG